MNRNSWSFLPIINKEAYQKSKDLLSLQVSDKVRIQQDKLWKREGIVIKKLPYHSYNIKLNDLFFLYFKFI